MSSTRTSTLLFLGLLLISGVFLSVFGQAPITGDDAWGATAVLGNPLEVVIFTLRWDLHPPFYYSFLDIWALFNKSDFWLKMCSAFLHSLTTALAFRFVLKKHGLLGAIITALFIFSSPLLLEYSIRIRMYSFVAFLSLCLFLLVDEIITKGSKPSLWGYFAVGFVLANSHAIGILFVFFHFIYGCTFFLKDKTRLIVWTLINSTIALLALPAIANSMVKSVSHAAQPTLGQVIHLLKTLFISGSNWLVLLAFSALALLTMNKNTRAITAFYIVLPLVIFASLSYTVKPLWLDRNFVFALPLLGIAIGIAAAQIQIPNFIKVLITAVIAIPNIWNFSVNTLENKFNNTFSDTALFLVTEINSPSVKTCIISTSTLNGFWSLQRYVNKVDWGNPTEVQPPISQTWKNIANKAPTFVDTVLKLDPRPNFTESNSLIISSGETSRCLEPDIHRTLVVSNEAINALNEVYRNDDYFVYESTSLPSGLDEKN